MSREYILPLYTNEEEQRLARKRRSIMSENGRSKYAGLDRYPWTTEQKRKSTHSNEVVSGPPFRFLECKVVPEQPLLRIRRTSVTHGGLMLYDGEKCVGLECYINSPYAYSGPIDPWFVSRLKMYHPLLWIFYGLVSTIQPWSRHRNLWLREIFLYLTPMRQNIVSSTNQCFLGTKEKPKTLLRIRTLL